MNYYIWPKVTPIDDGMYIVVCKNDYGKGPEYVHCLNTWTNGKWDVDYANMERFSDRINKFAEEALDEQ